MSEPISLDARLGQPTVGSGISTLGAHHTGPTTTSAHVGAGPNSSSGFNSSSGYASNNNSNSPFSDNTHQAARDTANDARATAHDASVGAQRTAQDVSSAASRTAQDVSQSTQNAAQNAKQTAQDVSANAQQKAQEVSRSAQQTAQNVQQTAQEKLNQAGNKLNQAGSQANAKLQQVGEQVAHHPMVQSAQQTTQQQLNVLDQQLARFGFLNEFEARTNIPKTYGVLGVSSTLALLILSNVFGLAQPITNLIGWALPAYLTCHALESRQKGDDAQWLCYWIVFGFLNYIESAALRVVLYYVPHYFTFKLAFTLWLMLPQTRGAERVYYSALRPLFHTGQSKVKELNQTTPTNTTSQFGNTASNRFGTASDSQGYSTGVNTNFSTQNSSNTHNPFVGQSAAAGSGFDGLHTTSAGTYGRVGGIPVPPAAGYPLPQY